MSSSASFPSLHSSLHSLPSFLFLQSHPPHRLLHSFPTRRSSDLRRHTRAPDCRSRSMQWMRSPPSSWSNTPTSKRRSEEHTSELQSRGQLVCRLLLEKKNAI